MDNSTQIANINIAKELAAIIGSRDVVNRLKVLIEKTRPKVVNLNFDDVEFVSRSAVHELLMLKDNFHKKILRKKIVNFINTRENVTKMFRTVAANRALPKQESVKLDIQKVDVNRLPELIAS